LIGLLDRIDNRPKLHALDLVLLDMHLPNHDGEEILKKLRSTEHYALTPVIVMTASLSPKDRMKAEKHAALHYFNKPANLDDFMKLGVLVGQILQKKKDGGRSEGGERHGEAVA
jgi:DNA-binding response OmpR family regulator